MQTDAIPPAEGSYSVDTHPNYGYNLRKTGVKRVFLLSEALNGRNGHQVGRQLLARLYRQATGDALPPIETTSRGKPYFPKSPWHFSISHTKHYAFCVLSLNNVGLDAEETDRAVSPALARRYLSPAERARIGADAQKEALRLWVLKEAEAKRTGRGIGDWMKETDFDPYDRRIQEMDGCFVAVLEDNDAV